MLDDVVALFTGDGRLDDLGSDDPAARDLLNATAAKLKAAMASMNGGSNGTMSSSGSAHGSNTPSKKRVLGERSKCQKPVTGGARHIHMFFHLGNDYNIYRFRCKYPGCTVEHYHKDQMENHHSKQHGKIDAEMMEDRSLELFQRCQELSIELLGTNGSTPGPAMSRTIASLSGSASSSSQSAAAAAAGSGLPKDESMSMGIAVIRSSARCATRRCRTASAGSTSCGTWPRIWASIGTRALMCEFEHDRSQPVQSRRKIPLSSSHRDEDDLRKEENEEDGETEELKPSDDSSAQLLQLTVALSGQTQQHVVVTKKGAVKRKPISMDVREQMAKLRWVSDVSDDVRPRLQAPQRLPLLLPPLRSGHYSREIVVRHVRGMHRSSDLPIDKRLQFVSHINEMVCYPQYFVDAPLPTEEAISRLRSQIGTPASSTGYFTRTMMRTRSTPKTRFRWRTTRRRRLPSSKPSADL